MLLEKREQKKVRARARVSLLKVSLESGSSGTRQGLTSAHQLTARASLRPSNTSAHESVNNSLKLMHAPHQQIRHSPNGWHGNRSGEKKKKKRISPSAQTIVQDNWMQRCFISKLSQTLLFRTIGRVWGARAPAAYGERARAGHVSHYC